MPEQGLGRSHDLALDSDGKVVTEKRAWQALRALLIGFFMILVDATIVTTAMPAIIHNLHTDLDGGVWVTSAYLLTYAVPLLISGRLGDRFGTRNIYAIGMTIFTLA
ncbi:MAG: MFS transporter, partial [Cutibacterium granulosum]|uniref:MFS transporter n=2 Tax=Cutibacterium granulosum TaxID=33011 RepID=UPI002B22CAC2